MDMFEKGFFGFMALLVLCAVGFFGYALFIDAPNLYERGMNGDRAAAIQYCDSYGNGNPVEYCLNTMGFEIVEQPE